MSWNKVISETMPPEMVPIIVTLVDLCKNNEKTTRVARLNRNKWEILFISDDEHMARWEHRIYGKIDYWMHFPNPA